MAVRTIDAALRLVAALRFSARERGGSLPSIDVADALLDERREQHRQKPTPAGMARCSVLRIGKR
jgi:hypothetical protein